MSGKTSISWTDMSWNPVVGCNQISPGCGHCYAKSLHDMRHKAFHEGKKVPAQYSKKFEEIQLMPDRLGDPLKWRKPQKIFVNSMSDLFHEDVPFDFIDRVFAVMALAERHTFQILTKRPKRMLGYLAECDRDDNNWGAPYASEEQIKKSGNDRINQHIASHAGMPPYKFRNMWPLPNVWLGISCEDQKTADERIPLLLQCPAAVRFVSYEPALEAVDFSRWIASDPIECSCYEVFGTGHQMGCAYYGANDEQRRAMSRGCDGIDWLIIGGESGPGARPFNIDWARDVLRLCRESLTRCFVKQLGANVISDNETVWPEGTQGSASVESILSGGASNIALKDKKGGSMEEWPSDLRVRQFPDLAEQTRRAGEDQFEMEF